MKRKFVYLYAGLCMAISCVNAEKGEIEVDTESLPERAQIRLPGGHPDKPDLLQEAFRSFKQGDETKGWEQLREARSWAKDPEDRLVEEAIQIRKIAQYFRETNSYSRFREMIDELISRIDTIEKEIPSKTPKTQVRLYEAVADFHYYIRKDRIKAMELYEGALAVTADEDVQVHKKLNQIEERHPADRKLREKLKRSAAQKSDNP